MTVEVSAAKAKYMCSKKLNKTVEIATPLYLSFWPGYVVHVWVSAAHIDARIQIFLSFFTTILFSISCSPVWLEKEIKKCISEDKIRDEYDCKI
jgi:hypothetical protein